jgi:paraquat-inducible protein A
MTGTGSYPHESAAAHGFSACHTCCKLAPSTEHNCPRCNAPLHVRQTDSLARTMALVLTSSILYIPANVLPIMTTDQLGSSLDSTILGGVVLLWEMGSYPVAAVIFIASVMVPLGKLVMLILLCWSVARREPARARERAVAYRVTEFVGRWSMIDVFVVAILVSLIQLGGLMVIRPGTAALAFCGVVIVTMIGAEQFDPRLIWDRLGASAGSTGDEATVGAAPEREESIEMTGARTEEAHG